MWTKCSVVAWPDKEYQIHHPSPTWQYVVKGSENTRSIKVPIVVQAQGVLSNEYGAEIVVSALKRLLAIAESPTMRPVRWCVRCVWYVGGASKAQVRYIPSQEYGQLTSPRVLSGSGRLSRVQNWGS